MDDDEDTLEPMSEAKEALREALEEAVAAGLAMPDIRTVYEEWEDWYYAEGG